MTSLSSPRKLFKSYNGTCERQNLNCYVSLPMGAYQALGGSCIALVSVSHEQTSHRENSQCAGWRWPQHCHMKRESEASWHCQITSYISDENEGPESASSYE